MPERRTERRLAAIVATDMVGYSRHMQADEAGTIARQKAHREDLIDPKIAEYHGRIVNTTGDGLIVEFASAVDAVQCAAEVQRAMAERDAEVPEDRRIRYRVGINIGDIVIDGDDIQGDGVIIAARLQALAEPGGICVSGKIFEEVKNKVELGFADLGANRVKNIAEPVPAYKVLLDPADRDKLLPAKRSMGIPSRRRVGGLAALLLLFVAAVLAWWQPWVTRVEPASLAKMAFPLPKKPSIAVLPFNNLSGDKTQDYLADGLSENIIQALSKVPEMFVIARNSTFIYKGKAVKVQRVAEELGVRYVLEGSVQRSGDRIRVTAQLIDAISGHHLWSERYDRKLADLFSVQDEITKKIVVALQVKLTEGEQARLLERHGTENREAEDLYLRALEKFRRFTRNDNAQSRQLLERAVDLDPGFPMATGLLAWTHWAESRFGWSADGAKSFKLAVKFAEKTLTLDDKNPAAYALLGALRLLQRKHDDAIAYGKKAVELNPNGADDAALLALTLTYSGRPNEAISLAKRAMRLSPYYPGWYLNILGHGSFLAGRYDDAIAAHKESYKRNPRSPFPDIRLAATYAKMGRYDEARAHAAKVLERNPKFSVKGWAKVLFYKNPADKERELSLLRKAGLPEGGPPQPTKPSIAVLPFTNMSGDKAQEYFADGMTDDLITGLSKLSGLIVISRTTAFTFKGKKDVKMKDIARSLGVRYVLEGSVRRAGGKVRINAQLIDGTTGDHVWAETFDRDYKQIFALQDEVKGKIIQALKVKLKPGERKTIKRKPTENLEAYDFYLKAEKLRLTYLSKNYRTALALYDKALALDSNFVDAHVGNARASFRAWRLGWLHVIPAPKAKVRARESLAKVLALDPGNAGALAVQVEMQLQLLNHDVALALARGAVARHPQDAILRAQLARVLVASDKLDEAHTALTRAEALAPKPSPELLIALAGQYAMLGDAGRAVSLLLRARAGGGSRFLTAVILINAYARLDNMEKAKAELETARNFWPGIAVAWGRVALAYHRNKRLLKNWFDASLKAGVPEWPHGFKGREEYRMRQAQLEKLFRRGPFKRIGRDHFGRRFEAHGDGKGNETYVSFRGRRRIRVPRTIVIERDRLCSRTDFSMMGRKICSPVYRNPQGSPKTNNEYILTYIFGVHRFSVTPVNKQ